MIRRNAKHINRGKSREGFLYRDQVNAANIELLFGIPLSEYRTPDFLVDPDILAALENPPLHPMVPDGSKYAICGMLDLDENNRPVACTRFQDLHTVHYNHECKRAWKT